MSHRFEYAPRAVHLCNSRRECVQATIRRVRKNGPPIYTHPDGWSPGATPNRVTYEKERTERITINMPPEDQGSPPRAGDFLYCADRNEIYITKHVRNSRSKIPGRNFLVDFITEGVTPTAKIGARFVVWRDKKAARKSQ